MDTIIDSHAHESFQQLADGTLKASEYLNTIEREHIGESVKGFTVNNFKAANPGVSIDCGILSKQSGPS